MDWFKMQTVWGSSIERMTDSEAGRFIKAVYAYVRSGIEYEGTGKEEMLVWQAIDTLRNDIAKFAEAKAAADDAKRAKSEAMRQLARRRWDMRNDAERMRTDATRIEGNADACEEMRSDAIRMRSDAHYKNKNKNKSNSNPSIPFPVASDGMDDDSNLEAIQAEHNEIFDAMEYAGFDMDGATMEKVIGLYAQYGKEKVLKAIDACVENSVKKIVYLKGVLESREREESGQTENQEKESSADEVRWLD